MKILHLAGYTRDERLAFRPTVYRNLLDSAQAVILHMRKQQVDCALPENRTDAAKIAEYVLVPGHGTLFAQDVARAIARLARDPVVRPILDDFPADLYLMDSAN
jgi:guanine nucleotide-binding protein G(i) subunit alpha